MEDYRDLLRIGRGLSAIVENRYGGAYLVDSEGGAILHVREAKKVLICRFMVSNTVASQMVDTLLWTVPMVRDRKGILPEIPPGASVIEALRAQLPGLAVLYAEPGSGAWARAMAEDCGDYPLVEGRRGSTWPKGKRVILGLPSPDDLGWSWRFEEDYEGLLIFERQVAAVVV